MANMMFQAIHRMSWAEYVARKEGMKSVYRVLVGNLRERDHLADPGVDERIILR